MTKFQTALSAASLLLLLGASTVPAPAQTLNTTCSVPNAPARVLTNYIAERPATNSMLSYYPQGTAIVQLDLSADGTPQNPTIVKSTGDYQLDQAAKAAALSQQFAPEVRNCQNVAGSYLYEVDYND